LVEGEERVNFNIDAPNFPESECAKLEDKDFFFPKIGRQEAERLPQLRAICSSCTHEKECLTFALDEQIAFGFWGGKSANERRVTLVQLDRVAVKGVALRIKNLRHSGRSVREIASLLKTPPYYISRVFKRLDEAKNKGADRLIKQTENLSEDSW
jgi:hypothetical protein